MLKHEKNTALARADVPIKPRYARVPKAAAASGLSRSFLYEKLTEGKVKSHKVGAIRLVDLQSLEEFIASHAA